MTEHQEQLWRRMLESIDHYTSRAIRFPRLVDELEASLQAGTPWEPSILQSWYSCWQELEIHRAVAVNGTDPNVLEVEADVRRMRRFLIEQLHNSA